MPGATSDAGYDEVLGARGGSDEDDSLTPAQSRRKAQNRAAYVVLCLDERAPFGLVR